MSNSARDTFLNWAAVAIGLVLILSISGNVLGTLAYRRAGVEGIESVDNRLRAVETKINPMAYVWRCDECQTTIATGSDAAPVCGGCGLERRFCFVGKWE